MVKKNVADLSKADLEGKVVFVRADLNVPQVRRLRGLPRTGRCTRLHGSFDALELGLSVGVAVDNEAAVDYPALRCCCCCHGDARLPLPSQPPPPPSEQGDPGHHR